MNTRLDGTSLFTGLSSGLTNTYSLLAQQFPNGVTLENLSTAQNKLSSNGTYLNPTFTAYMQQNFANLDKDKDGKISATDLNQTLNQLNTQGLTIAQLNQLAMAGVVPQSLLSTVMSHFSDIDKNHDGKVTNSEIKEYGVTSEMEKKRSDFASQKASSMSMFYTDNASSTESSSSILDSRYLGDNELT